MRLCVIHPKRCKESATKLAQALGADVSNPYRERRYNYRHYDMVINYGFGDDIAGNLFNNTNVVKRCKNKFATLSILSIAGIPVPKFTNSKFIASKLNLPLVCHTQKEGMQNQGIEYVEGGGVAIPDAHLYTEYFHHKREYRVVVLKHKVVGIYRKDQVDKDTWDLNTLSHKGFKSISDACIKASKALLADYVGFDVVANTREDFRILEANSGPIITDEVIEAFKQLFNK